MASSAEAFRKFSRWKKWETVLKFTVFEHSGIPKSRRGQIFHADEDRLVVGFMESSTRKSEALDFTGAKFVVTGVSIEVYHPDLGSLLFEEI